MYPSAFPPQGKNAKLTIKQKKTNANKQTNKLQNKKVKEMERAWMKTNTYNTDHTADRDIEHNTTNTTRQIQARGKTQM